MDVEVILKLGVALTTMALLLAYVTSPDWGVFWTAAGAIFTAVAAAIALWLPFRMEEARKLETESERRKFYADVFYQIRESINIHRAALTLGVDIHDTEGAYATIRNIEERSLNNSKVLERLLNRSGVADRLIARAQDAIDLDIETAKAVSYFYNPTEFSLGLDHLKRQSTRLARTEAGMADHREALGLPRNFKDDVISPPSSTLESSVQPGP